MLRILIACSAVLALASIAEAKDKPAGKKQPRVFDFEGDLVETEYLKPDAAMVEGMVRGKQSSLIKIRRDFVAEIVKSAEDI